MSILGILFIRGLDDIEILDASCDVIVEMLLILLLFYRSF